LAIGTGTLLPYEPKRRIQAAVASLSKRDVAIISTAGSTNLRAITRLQVYFDSPLYLYVATSIEPALVKHISRLRTAVGEYLKLKDRRSTLEVGFFLLFAIVALLLLFAAIWLGLMFADRLARPIINLINAADRVGGGDYEARVPEGDANDEVTSLSRAFNRMTSQLDRNRRELVEANQLIDARRQFTETVLAGVSAGVIGLDAEGRISLPNRSASELLATDLGDKIGNPLGQVVPEMGDMLARILSHPRRAERGEITVEREGKVHTLLVRMASEMLSEEVIGFVVTFDDITELQTAQRLAAWADVARRIAHEIKNPLTPIQLSAERLRRKYLDEIKSDREAFEICTDTIVRQVGDIGRLVDEFSDFARMPSPTMSSVDLRDICRQAIFLLREGYQEIKIDYDLPDAPVLVTCDRRQIAQALTNLLKNAAEAISEGEQAGTAGQISVTLTQENGQAQIVVKDNGRGLPQDLLPRLTEPYVTTRAKGTGLGLAIVRKIMEDHFGALALHNRPEGGAIAALTFRAEDSLPAAETPLPEQAAE
jgi:two-component system nitrogen regulation sensor histidine kinase NtrY